MIQVNFIGDIGFYDEDGNVFLVDREKQMIKVDGFQVDFLNSVTIFLISEKVKFSCIYKKIDFCTLINYETCETLTT